jgi:hypothetical protein
VTLEVSTVETLMHFVLGGLGVGVQSFECRNKRAS